MWPTAKRPDKDQEVGFHRWGIPSPFPSNRYHLTQEDMQLLGGFLHEAEYISA